MGGLLAGRMTREEMRGVVTDDQHFLRPSEEGSSLWGRGKRREGAFHAGEMGQDPQLSVILPRALRQFAEESEFQDSKL